MIKLIRTERGDKQISIVSIIPHPRFLHHHMSSSGPGYPDDPGGPGGSGGPGDPGGQYEMGGQICQGELSARLGKPSKTF